MNLFIHTQPCFPIPPSHVLSLLFFFSPFPPPNNHHPHHRSVVRSAETINNQFDVKPMNGAGVFISPFPGASFICSTVPVETNTKIKKKKTLYVSAHLRHWALFCYCKTVEWTLPPMPNGKGVIFTPNTIKKQHNTPGRENDIRSRSNGPGIVNPEIWWIGESGTAKHRPCYPRVPGGQNTACCHGIPGTYLTQIEVERVIKPESVDSVFRLSGPGGRLVRNGAHREVLINNEFKNYFHHHHLWFFGVCIFYGVRFRFCCCFAVWSFFWLLLETQTGRNEDVELLPFDQCQFAVKQAFLSHSIN